MMTCLVLLIAAGSAERCHAALTGEACAKLERALSDKSFAALEEAIKAVNLAGERGPAMEVIRTRLKAADPAVRRLAAYALSEIDREEAKKAVPMLIEALRDNEPRIRARVALALAKMGTAAREAVPALAELLNDADPRARAGAMRALGQLGEAQATVPLIVKLLKDPEAPVRQMAAGVLGQMGPPARSAISALNSLQTTDQDAGVRAAAAAALEAIDPTLRVLVDALAASDADRRLWAVSLLTHKGSEARDAVPNIIEVLKKDDSVPVRAGAAFALGKIGSGARTSCPALIETLADKDGRVRTAAALALGLIGPDTQGAGRALAATLKDEDADVAASAATALANLGPEAEVAVAMLIDMLKQDNVVWRRRAVNVLARIGQNAKSATAALLDALKDSDPVLRREAARALVSVGPQVSAPIPALIEALCQTQDSSVRAWACLSLGQIGPAAGEAVAPLLHALQDDDHSVRAGAVFALSRIGPSAVPALVKALDDLDPCVRAGAASALGGIGAGARRAHGQLREALRDEDAGVCLAAAAALGRIAVEVQFAQDTKALADLEETRKALENVKGGRRPEERAEWSAAIEKVREAIRALRTVQRAQVFERILPGPLFPIVAGALVYGSVLLGFWFLLLWLRPLLLLRINDILRPLPRLRLPTLLGGMEMSLRSLLLLGFFSYHRRVLDAWIARHIEPFRDNYLARRTVMDRKVYVPVPVILDGQVVPGPTAVQLGQVFGCKRGCMLIWGEDGSGKTTLACQIGRWAFAQNSSERLCDHVMLPVLIEHELEHQPAEGEPAFMALTEAVRGQLQAQIGLANLLSEELLDHLLRQRRILVIVDRLLDVSAAARTAIHPGHADFPAHALVVISRSEEALDGVPKSIVQPLRIEGHRLSAFMEAYLVERGKRQLFDDVEHFEACRRLSLLAGARSITVLLAKLFAEQMIARKESWPQGTLPTNLPDLILGYLNELNRAVGKDRRRGDFQVQRDAEALAWECLRHTLRPQPVNMDSAIEALGGVDAAARLEYLEEHLKIIHAAEPAKDRVSFTLEPMAEYLAALHLVNKNRGDTARWQEFAAQWADLPPDRETTNGFLLAVRECCQARQVAKDVLDLLDKPRFITGVPVWCVKSSPTQHHDQSVRLQ